MVVNALANFFYVGDKLQSVTHILKELIDETCPTGTCTAQTLPDPLRVSMPLFLAGAWMGGRSNDKTSCPRRDMLRMGYGNTFDGTDLSQSSRARGDRDCPA